MSNYVVLGYKKLSGSDFILIENHTGPLPVVDVFQFDNQDAACAKVDELMANDNYIYAYQTYEGY